MWGGGSWNSSGYKDVHVSRKHTQLIYPVVTTVDKSSQLEVYLNPPKMRIDPKTVPSGTLVT